MNDQLFQQLLDSVTQMTEIIKKQQETIDKLLEQEVEYKVCERVVEQFPSGFINMLKTTGIGGV